MNYGPVRMDNIDGATRIEFAVIGDTVTIASRIEHLARGLGSPLVFSDDLVRRLQDEIPDGLSELADRGPQALKGRVDPVRIWTLG